MKYIKSNGSYFCNYVGSNNFAFNKIKYNSINNNFNKTQFIVKVIVRNFKK